MYRKYFISIAFILAFMAGGSVAADTIGERHTFFVNSTYDAQGRTSLAATLHHVGQHAYFYVEDAYLSNLNTSERNAFDARVSELAQEFDTVIYPRETAFWGSEAQPGLDNDPRITILLERLAPGTGGYFDSINNYSTAQAPKSNQREMLVGNVLSVGSERLKVFIAHELQHLISSYRKDFLHRTSEDVWLNELRSQYAVTAAGYNTDIRNSDLSQRLSVFLSQPTDSLTEWPNVGLDYAPATLFGHYLADRFGPGMLKDTLDSPLIGIASINEWLGDHGEAQRFEGLFADWAWANYINNRNQNIRFGYANPVLQSFHVPLTDRRFLTSFDRNIFSYSLKPWQSEWFQFILDTNGKDKNIRVSWQDSAFKIYYGDESGNLQQLTSGNVIPQPSVGNSFILMPINTSLVENFGIKDPELPLSLVIEYTVEPASSAVAAVQDGSLIMHAGTPDIYVVTGPYKRLLVPEVLKFYGLNAAQAVTVSEAVFQSYRTSNYVRAINEQKVYALWPDGTKHWLNMTAQHFTDSFRDWNSVFIINDLESKFYRVGSDITQ